MDEERAVGGQGWAMMGSMGIWGHKSYEGLPPEVGAFNSQN